MKEGSASIQIQPIAKDNIGWFHACLNHFSMLEKPISIWLGGRPEARPRVAQRGAAQ